MTNFIYIFMIIALIGIGVGIKAFNSEDSDTKTNVKNIPRGLKKVLLIGKNVHKTDIVMLIGIIIYWLFTVGVTGIYLFASHKLKVATVYKGNIIKKLNNGLPILHKVPPKRDYGRYFCIMAEKGGTSHGGLTEKLSPFFHAVCPAKLDHTSRCKSGHGNRQ